MDHTGIYVFILEHHQNIDSLKKRASFFLCQLDPQINIFKECLFFQPFQTIKYLCHYYIFAALTFKMVYKICYWVSCSDILPQNLHRNIWKFLNAFLKINSYYFMKYNTIYIFLKASKIWLCPTVRFFIGWSNEFLFSSDSLIWFPATWMRTRPGLLLA